MPVDFKKTEKELYQPKTTPSIVNVPAMTFIVVSGKGDPNAEIGEFQTAAELLFGLSYAIKMSNKDKLEYVVPPLEGIWRAGNSGSGSIAEKSKFEWTLMIRQPDFVTNTIFETAKASFAQKKKHLVVSKARLEQFTEGLCVQAMHIGGYDSEHITIDTIEAFAKSKGYIFDITGYSAKTLSRRHHEIYFSNPKKVETENLKTAIRYPLKRRA
jgi:hypothetical protein